MTRPRKQTRIDDQGPKPLLVGEDNPRHSDPKFALYPLPPNGAGDRLAKILGLSRWKYLQKFDRVNLCPSNKWVDSVARERAVEIVNYDERNVVIALGVKVCKAFGVPFIPFSSNYMTTSLKSGCTIVVLPHPSGLCRIWNDKTSVRKARAILRGAGVDL